MASVVPVRHTAAPAALTLPLELHEHRIVGVAVPERLAAQPDPIGPCLASASNATSKDCAGAASAVASFAALTFGF